MWIKDAANNSIKLGQGHGVAGLFYSIESGHRWCVVDTFDVHVVHTLRQYVDVKTKSFEELGENQ